MSLFRKTLDTAVALGRAADHYITRPLRGICPTCNNLSPRDHVESSNNSLGFLDDISQDERLRIIAGAIWLNLEIKVADVLKTAKGYAKPVKPCIYCIMLLKLLQHYLPDWFIEHPDPSDSELSPNFTGDQDTIISLILVEGNPVIVQTHDSSSDTENHPIAIEIGPSEIPSRYLPDCGSFYDRAARSDDPAVWSFIHDCVEKCNSQHDACSPSTDPTKLPKRLLDVGNQDDLVRLYETELEETGCYAAFSHCWGSGYPVRTMLDNVEQYKSCIDSECLGNTFKNAIEITRRLGLRFLWIDSLCIIQDSKEDWEEQAAQMANIYQYAYVTIAAGSSPNPDTPIFGARGTEWLPWCVPLGSGEQGEDIRVRRSMLPVLRVTTRGSYGEAQHLQSGSSSSHNFFNYVWDGPIYARAWCFQEQLLSRRMIHYGPGGVIWECQDERRIEGKDAIRKEKMHLAPNDSQMQEQWRINVANYSQRDITFASDRLVALAGVASFMAQQTNDRYLAGLWSSSLFWDLLWHPSPWVEAAVSDTSIAPTWSWASLEAPVIWNQHSSSSIRHLLAQIESAETTPKTDLSPFGDVLSGSVTICGPVIEASMVFDEESSESGVCIVGDWEKREKGHFVLPDVRMYEADGLLDDGSTEKTYRRAQDGEDCSRYTDDDGETLSYDMKLTILCFLNTKALDVIGLVLGRSTTISGAYVRLAQVWKLPDEYVKRAEVKSVVLV